MTRLPAPLSVYLAFCIYSFSLGAIFPRLGDLQLQMGIGEATLGLSIIGIALGAQISLLMASRLLRIIGFRAVMLLTIPMIGIAEYAAALAAGPVGFFMWLFVTGLALGVIEVAVNVEADRVEYGIGRRIMNRSHAFWSFGFFGAGLTGALLAQAGMSVALHIASFAIIGSVAVAIVFARYKQAQPRPSEDGQHITFARPTKPILMLVALTLSAMLLEGAGIDWSVIYMRDVFSTPPFISGLALALGAFCQFAVRFFADRVIEQYGPETVTARSVLVLGFGVVLITFAPNPVIALAGFALMGAGHAVIFPLAMSAAAQRTDRPAAVNVAALAQLSFVIFLLAPPLLGAIAEYFGIRASFGLGLPLVVLSWFTVKALRPR